jgi:hypothetical protein
MMERQLAATWRKKSVKMMLMDLLISKAFNLSAVILAPAEMRGQAPFLRIFLIKVEIGKKMKYIKC